MLKPESEDSVLVRFWCSVTKQALLPLLSNQFPRCLQESGQNVSLHQSVAECPEIRTGARDAGIGSRTGIRGTLKFLRPGPAQF